MFNKFHTSPRPNLQIKFSTLKHRPFPTASPHLRSSTPLYLDLELFKQQSQGGELSFHYTYAECHYKVRSYRTIFFAIGILFLGLAFLIFQHNLVFFSFVFGNLSFPAKGVLIGASLIFSFAASFISYSLCIANEASDYLLSKAKRKLFQIYSRKRLTQGLTGLFNLGTFCKKHYALKSSYQEILYHIEEIKENTALLLKKIQNHENIDLNYRELLFNQALCEMQDKLKISLQGFKQN